MRTLTSSRAENFSIGELSKHSGVNIETIRYYERIKMLPAPPRTATIERTYVRSEEPHPPSTDRRTSAVVIAGTDAGPKTAVASG